MDKADLQHRGEGHRQRLRDKFLEYGGEVLSDEEVIELLLTFGTPRSDCKEAARQVLKTFGSLSGVLDAPAEALRAVDGIGPKNAFAIHFIQTAARRYLKQRVEGRHYITSSRDVADYLVHSMRGLKHEVFTVLFLDASHAVICTEVLSEGTNTVNTVYPREVIKKALAHNAAAIVVAHNHPSGSLQPSNQDRQLTRTLYLTCDLMNIRLLDHLIVGAGDTPFSFADNGLMSEVREACALVRDQAARLGEPGRD